MFKKMNRVAMFIMVLVLMIAALGAACAENLMPYADEVFDSASINLKSSKRVTFIGMTHEVQSIISITSCWLEQKNGNTWSRVCSLPVPSASTNVYSYTKEMNYSSQIGSGTFRIGATFNGSGHTITRYSLARTF